MQVKWRYYGMFVGWVVGWLLPARELFVGNHELLQLAVCIGVGLFVGEVAERVNRGQPIVKVSLVTFLVLTTLAPLAIAWGYLEWKDGERRPRDAAHPQARTIQEILGSDELP